MWGDGDLRGEPDAAPDGKVRRWRHQPDDRGGRVWQCQSGGVQRDASVTRRAARSVAGVADDRHPARGKLQADLVVSPGVEGDEQQRVMPCVPDDGITRARLTTGRIDAGDIAPGIGADSIDHVGGTGVGPAGNNCEIPARDGAVLQRLLKRRECVGSTREHDDSTHRLVDAVTRMQLRITEQLAREPNDSRFGTSALDRESGLLGNRHVPRIREQDRHRATIPLVGGGVHIWRSLRHTGAVRIVQLTDIHLDLDQRFPHGTDTWGNFGRSCEIIRRLDPDLLVISGDIALSDGNPRLYSEVAERCDGLARDVLYLPGNHDRRELFGDAFGRRYRLAPGRRTLDRVVRAGGYALLLIDSADGVLMPSQLGWLELVLESHSAQAAGGQIANTLPIFVHHPVITGFHRYMDAEYRLENADSVAELLANQPVLRPYIFCGHYHCEHETRRGTAVQMTTPSTYCNTVMSERTFALDHTTPAVREIVLEAGAVSSVVHYADDGAEADGRF